MPTNIVTLYFHFPKDGIDWIDNMNETSMKKDFTFKSKKTNESCELVLIRHKGFLDIGLLDVFFIVVQ